MKTNTHFFIISRSVSLRIRNVSDKIGRENENTHFVFMNFFFKSCVCEIMWKNMIERGRPQMTIWRMRIACSINKTTNVCNTDCLSTATMVARTRLNITPYALCLPC